MEDLISELLKIISIIYIPLLTLFTFPLIYHKVDADVPFWSFLSRLYLLFYKTPIKLPFSMSRKFRQNQKIFQSFSINASLRASKSKEEHLPFHDEQYIHPKFNRMNVIPSKLNYEKIIKAGYKKSAEKSIDNLVSEIESGYGSDIIIKGSGGLGKTNLCRYLLYYFCEVKNVFPGGVFYLRARVLSSYMLNTNENSSGKIDRFNIFISNSRKIHFPYILFLVLVKPNRTLSSESFHS